MSGPYDQQKILAQAAGRSAGQTVTQTTSVHRSAEVLHAQPQQHSSSRGDRQRLPRSGSSTSLSSSPSGHVNRNYVGAVITTAGPILAGSHSQYAAGNGYAYGGATSGASVGSIASGPRRPGRYQKQVIRLPDQCAGQVRQVRCRMPTPEPDTLERVYIQRAPNETVEEITEIPTTPPPRIQERTVVEPAGPPQIIKRVIRVPPRGGSYGGQQQQSASFVGGSVQSGSNLLGAGSYGNVQQAAGGYQQYASGVPAYTGGAMGGGYAGTMGGGYGGIMGGGYGDAIGGGYGGIMGGGYGGAIGGGYGGTMGGGFQGQQGFGYGAQPSQQPMAAYPAFCYQV